MKPLKLTVLSLIFSVVNLLMFHIPFFRHACSNVESGANGVIIIISLALLLLALNFFAFYLLLYLGRTVGKVIVALSFIGNAVSLYFINTLDVIIDDSMMGNVFNTNYAEATSYWSFDALLYILAFGVLPAVLLLLTKVNYGSLKRAGANLGLSLAVALGVAFGNMSNWTWIDNNSTVLGSLLLPWSYTVNTFRYRNQVRERNREEIRLPDATITNDEKDVVVLIIGESARRDHFSLYGYERNTNPLLSATENVTALKANSCATYTIGGVKAILEPQDSDELYEILPNYLYRAGADVSWKATNWGEPPLHIEKVQRVSSDEYDEVLLDGLAEEIGQSEKPKVLVVLHTSTSHGPLYSRKYPPEFEIFSPVSTSVEMSTCPTEELINGYDNSIIYTDHLISGVISMMKGLTDWRSCVMFVSDHGESLGEGNLYMHGVPMKIAPKEQYEIPFIVWTSDGSPIKDLELVDQHHVFHSVLHFLGVESPAYKEELNIFL